MNIVNIYSQDLSLSCVEEIVRFQKIIKTFLNDEPSMSGLLKELSNSPLESTFTNVLVLSQCFGVSRIILRSTLAKHRHYHYYVLN